MIHRTVVGIITIALLSILGTHTSAAQLHFSPSSINIVGKPGQVVTRTITICSKSKHPLQLRIHAEDWWRTSDNKITHYVEPGTIKRSSAAWCSVNPAEARVEPGEELVIRVTVRIPENLEPGGYWGAVTIDEVPDPLSPNRPGVAVVFRSSLSVGLFVEIAPAARSARIVGVRLNGNCISINACNDGNIPLPVRGWIEFISPGSDKLTAKVEIPGGVLLPEPYNICEFTSSLPEPDILPSGRYRVRAILDLGLEYLLGAEKELDLVTRKD